MNMDDIQKSTDDKSLDGKTSNARYRKIILQ